MTASRVVRGNAVYTEKTRDKKLAKVDLLEYLPDQLKTVFAGDQCSTFVGVSIPDLGSAVVSLELGGIDRKLRSFGHKTVLGLAQHSLQKEENWTRTVVSWQSAGLILTGHYHLQKPLEMLRKADIPAGEIWKLNSSPLDMSVDINHVEGGFDMGRQLIGCG